MLYLVKSYFPMGKFIYKVGFSEDSNIKIRLDKYFYTSPGSEVISLREGDEMLEDLIHYYLYYLGYRYQKNGRLDEWFIGNSEVLSIFHISRESLERKIWKHRDKIFDKDKVKCKTSLDYKLFKYLYLKNKDSFIGVLIDLDRFKKPFRTKAKLVDSIFWGIYSKDLQLETKLKYLSNLIPSGDYEIAFQNFIYEFEETNRFSEKLQIYCEYLDYYKDIKTVFDNIRLFVKEPEYQKYYDFVLSRLQLILCLTIFPGEPTIITFGSSNCFEIILPYPTTELFGITAPFNNDDFAPNQTSSPTTILVSGLHFFISESSMSCPSVSKISTFHPH